MWYVHFILQIIVVLLQSSDVFICFQGYYSATLEAATQLIVQIADDQAALNRA